MTNSPRRFLYLLTLWQERPATGDRPAVWRFRLEDTRSNEQWGFGSPDDLLAFLQQQVEDREVWEEER